jgi:hypothetical protein
LDRDRDRLALMQDAAQCKAMTNSWENYRKQMAALAREVVEGKVET